MHLQDLEYYNKLEDPTDEENDMLDLAFGLSETWVFLSVELGVENFSFCFCASQLLGGLILVVMQIASGLPSDCETGT